MSENTPSMDRVRNMYARVMKPDGTVALWSRRQKEFDRWLAAHDRALREQIEREIEQYYLGPESGRFFDGRPALDAAEVEAFDDGLQLAARIARGEEQTDE